VIPTPVPYINYIYGLTSMKLPQYALATALGYFPGTVVFVSSGAAGKSLMAGGASGAAMPQPWYVYAAAAAFGSGFLWLAKSTIADIVRDIEASDKAEKIVLVAPLVEWEEGRGSLRGL
jgi:uncharacterized membrane protein YdjX (TVP38/TMEM64 family)